MKNSFVVGDLHWK